MIAKDETMVNKISYWHLACFVILLPFDFFYSQIVLISFAVHTVIHFKKERFHLLFNKQVLLLVIVYFIGLLTILYSSDKEEGLSVTGRQTVIFLFPVLLVLNELDLATYKLSLLKTFAATCVLVVIYLYFDAFKAILYFHLPLSTLLSDLFINHNFSAPIELHATYLSMYVALSICTLVFCLMQPNRRLIQLCYSAGILILLAGLVQLSSRAVVISFLMIINFVFPFFMLEKKQRKKFLAVALSASIAGALLIMSINTLKKRYVSELKNDLAQVITNEELLEPRVLRWKLALQIVKQAPIFGHGNGAEKKMLREAYYEHKLYISYLNSYNAHSQYLSFLIKAGIIGLLMYLYVLTVSFYSAVKKKDFLFAVFMIIITVVSVAENILDVNKGIFFFGFFLSLFTLSNHAKIFYKRQPPVRLQRFDTEDDL